MSEVDTTKENNSDRAFGMFYCVKEHVTNLGTMYTPNPLSDFPQTIHNCFILMSNGDYGQQIHWEGQSGLDSYLTTVSQTIKSYSLLKFY